MVVPRPECGQSPSMEVATADVIVVGLGAVGSAVSHHLAAGGARVVGIDRFAPPHDQGSSHGLTRITRLAVGEGAAFVPLVMGLYWKRATTQGAILSLAAGIGTWLLFFPQLSSLGESFPGQLAGLIAAFVGIVVGSLAPQVLKNRHEPHKTALSM